VTASKAVASKAVAVPMTALEWRLLLDMLYVAVAGASALLLAWQGWRRVPEARPLALALGILLVEGVYHFAASSLPSALGAVGSSLVTPVLDRSLGTLFLVILVFGLIRPLFPAYQAPLYWLLGSHLAFLAGLTFIVLWDYSAHWAPSLRFADYWGAVAFEAYQIPLLLAAMGVMLAVWRASRSSYAVIVIVALGLWLAGHGVHLAGLLAGQDTPVSWGNVLRLSEIAGLVLVAAALFVPDPARRSLAARYLADAGAMVTRLRAEVDRLTAAKAAMEERQRLARELHDSVSQSLFSIELNAGAAEALMEKDPARARERIGRLRGTAHEALNDLRALIAELHPPALEGKTLESALREHAAALQEREGLEVSIEADVAGELDPESQSELFRIGYEALTNVAKHARARHAWIALTVRPPSFRLSVSDDGVGMDPAAAGGQRTFGVSGMKQRAAILGARLTIGVRNGGGVQVVVER
jgi:signal transduction histidine kinase